jgi:NAD-dependent DNA ligase
MLLYWLDTNRHASKKWPANVLYERLALALEDGVLDDEEEKDLLETLVKVVGDSARTTESHSASTSLPIDDPLPDVIHEGRIFCITGKLVTGTRAAAVQEIESRGGQFKNSLTQKTDYLIIGEIGSQDWIHSTFGRKIEKALAIREKGISVAIISEQHWASNL